MAVPFVNLKAQHQSLQEEIAEAALKVLTNTNFILGDEVESFEQEFAAYCGTTYAIGVDSGLSALKLALDAHGIGEGDEVIVPANTFIATAAAVTFVGARSVFVDIQPDTYNIDPERLEAAITPRTKAIIPVHLYGIPADMDRILEVAERHQLVVIEDACQAHGAFYKGKRAGSLGDAAAFSCYPAKNLGAAGDAGILVTNNARIADHARAMRNCGQREKYYHVTTPYNHRLDTIQAAILRVKLRHLDRWNAQRANSAALYNQLLNDAGVITPTVPDDCTSVWHLYVIRSTQRDALKDYLGSQGIATGLHYPVPLHLQPYYQYLGYNAGDFPVAEAYADQILSLPMFPELRQEDVELIAGAIKQFAVETSPVP